MEEGFIDEGETKARVTARSKKGQQAVQCHSHLGGLEAMGGGSNEAGGIIVQ